MRAPDRGLKQCYFFAFLLVKYRKKTNIYLFLTLPMTWYLMSRSQNRIWELRLWYWFLLTLEWYIVFLYFLLINKHKIYDILHKYVLLNLSWCILENWLYLPVPKFEYSCMGLPRDCFNIPILHASSFKFLSFSELTALSSLSVADWVNNGHRKNCANLPKKKKILILHRTELFSKNDFIWSIHSFYKSEMYTVNVLYSYLAYMIFV